MQIGMMGLGRMGANMVRRLMRGGHRCVAFDLNADGVRALAREKAVPAFSLDQFVAKLKRPRAVWIMLPAGEPTEQAILDLSKRLSPGDVVIDGGNTYFKDDVRGARLLSEKGIHHVDVGTSGGIWGLERGYCLMIGGSEAVVKRLDPVFQTLSPGIGKIPRTGGGARKGTAEKGYLLVGPHGAGHFVKMVHNGIEYGLMQAYAEGFEIMKNASSAHLPEEHRYRLDASGVAELWRRGSVVGSWLLDLTAMALSEDPDLSGYSGFVQDSGEGRWTIMAALEEAVPANVLAAALFTRFRSRADKPFAEKVLSAMRKKFGGHVERASGG